ncbi:hypothetical protein HID58_065806, partial [Brassica napus]
FLISTADVGKVTTIRFSSSLSLQFLGLAAASGLKFPVEYGIVLEQQLKKEEDELRKNKRETSISSRDRNPDSGIPGDLKSDSDSSPDRDSRYGNYPPEATCGYSCKHKKKLEEDPSAFAFDEVYDDMKHRDIVPKLQDRQDLKDLVKGFQTLP